jgi:hypothetical protein
MPVPTMIQEVDVILVMFASPQAARVREPVVPAGNHVSVSVVITSVIVPAEQLLTISTLVPTGKATVPLAGIVHVRAVTSDEGWKI